MGKWSRYSKTYQTEWEKLPKFKGWLQRNDDEEQAISGKEAFCKACKTGLRAHKTDLARHAERPGHTKNMVRVEVPVTQRRVTDVGVTSASREAKKVDLMLAVYIACHSSIRSMDHLCEVLKIVGKGCKDLENLKLHRTKCSKLILNVLAPALLTELVEDIKIGYGFSLIVDESTDVSTKKYLAICCRYFSKKKNAITVEFLGFVEVPSATATNLKSAVQEYLKDIGLYELYEKKDLIGLGTDGASAMCGVNHSLFTLLREDVPNLQLVKCICHSLHLCSSAASKELPSCLEFLLRESRTWFSHSALRLSLYEELYATINDGRQCKKLIQLSKTRWLVMEVVVRNTLDQWLELKTHFNIVALNREDKCHTARILADLYNDDGNLLYLTFLRPILREISRVNLLFQSDSADVTQLFAELHTLLLSFSRRILKPAYLIVSNQEFLETRDFENLKKALQEDKAYLSTGDVDFGYDFNKVLQTTGYKEAEAVKQRCVRFLSSLCRELAQRLPGNSRVIDAIRFLSPAKCIGVLQPKFDQLPLFLAADGTDLGSLEEEWRKLPLKNWREHFPEKKIPEDVCEFWSAVHQARDAGNRPAFANLSAFALRVLSLPFSNAYVERVFSVMNSTKSKERNSLRMQMLVALLRVRLTLKSGNCCKGFDPSDNMYKLFTAQIYEKIHEGEGTSDNLDDVNENEALMQCMEQLNDDDTHEE